MKIQFTILLILSGFICGNSYASGNKSSELIKKRLSPDYLNFQYAGNLGLASVGIGYLSKNEKHNFGLSYGYLPSSVNSVEVHTVSFKGTFNFRKHHLSKTVFFNGYAGSNLLRSFTHNTYMNFPGHFPSDYYIPNAIHLAPFLGIKVGSRKTINKFSYIELGTLDYYLINSFKYKYMKFSDCWNVCLGLTFPLTTPKRNQIETNGL